MTTKSPSYDDAAEQLKRLLTIMAKLRGPDGCPWDQRQNARSLAPYLLEEAHEVLEAIEADDPDWMCEELGDLLLQVVFHAQLCDENRTFDMGQVIEGIADKLVRRHPHVFADISYDNEAELRAGWEQIKAEEKRQHGSKRQGSALPRHQTALQNAQMLQAKQGDPLRPPQESPALQRALNYLENLPPDTFSVQLPQFLYAIAGLAVTKECDCEADLDVYLRKITPPIHSDI